MRRLAQMGFEADLGAVTSNLAPLLRHLAAGLPLHDLASASNLPAVGDLPDALNEVADLMRTVRLSDPVTRAGLELCHVNKTSKTLPELANLASYTTRALSLGRSEQEILASNPSLTPLEIRAALTLSSMVMLDRYLGSLPPVGDQSIRDLIEHDDLRALGSLYRYKSIKQKADYAELTPEREFATWIALLRKLTSGPYNEDISEYQEALAQRDGLADGMALLSPPSHVRVRDLIEPRDWSFFEITEYLGIPVLQARDKKVRRWYWCRIPLVRGPRFEALVPRRSTTDYDDP